MHVHSFMFLQRWDVKQKTTRYLGHFLILESVSMYPSPSVLWECDKAFYIALFSFGCFGSDSVAQALLELLSQVRLFFLQLTLFRGPCANR
jgi:hypothetical protein